MSIESNPIVLGFNLHSRLRFGVQIQAWFESFSNFLWKINSVFNYFPFFFLSNAPLVSIFKFNSVMTSKDSLHFDSNSHICLKNGTQIMIWLRSSPNSFNPLLFVLSSLYHLWIIRVHISKWSLSCIAENIQYFWNTTWPYSKLNAYMPYKHTFIPCIFFDPLHAW